MFILKLVSTILFTFIIIYMIYYSLISIRAYSKPAEVVPHRKARKRFLVLIPAVNEEAVISIPVKDLLAQDYPSNLYEVVVIADHCTDRTASIARSLGTKVITTADHPEIKRHGVGKSNTLDYGLQSIGRDDWNTFDYLVVIDSDNEVAPNFLQRLNDYGQTFNEPEAIQVSLRSKHGHGLINTGLNLSFIRSNYFQQVPESYHGCASLLGTGFATSIKKVINPLGGFRFHTLVEDEFEELDILSRDGNIKFIPDTYIVNENYSEVKQASKGLTRWSRGSFQCMLYFITYAITHCIITPSYKNFHIFCRISTLSKATQLIIIWGYFSLNLIINQFSGIKLNLLMYPSSILSIIWIMNIVATLNLVIIENFYLLHKKYGTSRTIIIIIEAYLFQVFYNIINIWAVLTFWKHKWIVSNHGKELPNEQATEISNKRLSSKVQQEERIYKVRLKSH